MVNVFNVALVLIVYLIIGIFFATLHAEAMAFGIARGAEREGDVSEKTAKFALIIAGLVAILAWPALLAARLAWRPPPDDT